ncbi:MAG: lactate utilization protein [Bulleidia sp.]|nr:lactate utilization protein [Bulleidia sp.]
MFEQVKEMRRLQAQKAMKNLALHGFEASYFETKEEAFEQLKKEIPEGAVIANGGSMTLTEMGVFDWLKGNEKYHYLDRDAAEDKKKIFHASLDADVYLMSSNAVTMDGMLYNIDGNGNRLAALIYGPEKVYVVCGTNKLVRDLDEAKTRLETIASPANNIRLHKTNPCTVTGECMHCLSSTTICNQIVITRRNNVPGRIHVFLVNEELGY